MRKTKAFTIVELLAIIVILGIILIIVLPNIIGLSDKEKESKYNQLIDSIYLAAETYMSTELNNPSYPVAIELQDMIEAGLLETPLTNPITELELDYDQSVRIYLNDDNEVSYLYPGSRDESGASLPDLPSNMIPIYWDNANYVWKKADTANSNPDYLWYDYDEKIWANAVTVTAGTRADYQSAALGTTITEADILTYLVWVPRYKYRIPAGTGARTIDIVFESSNTTKSAGDAITAYRTHPAFTFGGLETEGIWMGKFETTGTIGSMTIKPNLASIGGQSTSTIFTNVRGMEAAENVYGFIGGEVDTHLSKASEWGAPAYLSYSIYGINSEIYKNNSSSHITGRSGGNVGGSQVKASGNEYITSGFYTYDGKCASTTTLAPGIDANCTVVGNTMNNKTLAYKASTTGNIYGIYDMSGDVGEYVMGNYNNYSGNSISVNSGFNGYNGGDASTTTGGVDFPESKYYNLYTTAVAATACGDGICYGHALSETAGWNGDYQDPVDSLVPWSTKGGSYNFTTTAGIVCFDDYYGNGVSSLSFRIIVIKES